MEQEAPAIVARFSYHWDAQAARSELAAAGVPSAVADDSVQGLMVQGFHLYVRKSDLATALEILGADETAAEPGLLEPEWARPRSVGLIGWFARLPRWVRTAAIVWSLLFGLGTFVQILGV